MVSCVNSGTAPGTAASGNVTAAAPRVPCSTCKIFVTASTWNGQFTGGAGVTVGAVTLAQLDNLCMIDANQPLDGGTYKAMIVKTTPGDTRTACTTVECSGGTSENTNWVLLPNHDYYRVDGITLIGTTNAGGVFPFSIQSLTNSISGVDQWYWTGLGGTGIGSGKPAWTNAVTCTNWTTTSAVGTEGHGNGTTGNNNGNDGAISGWQQICSDLLSLACAEQ